MWCMIEKVLYAILKTIYSVLHKELSDKIFKSYMQFLRFGVVGLSNTLISYFLYTISLLLFRYMHILPTVDYIAAQVIAFIMSVLWSFYWNNRIVFVLEDGKERSILKALIKTYISYSFTGLFLNSILLMLWVKIFHISEYIAPLINLIISVPVNFLINKFWAFKNNK